HRVLRAPAACASRAGRREARATRPRDWSRSSLRLDLNLERVAGAGELQRLRKALDREAVGEQRLHVDRPALQQRERVVEGVPERERAVDLEIPLVDVERADRNASVGGIDAEEEQLAVL